MYLQNFTVKHFSNQSFFIDKLKLFDIPREWLRVKLIKPVLGLDS